MLVQLTMDEVNNISIYLAFLKSLLLKLLTARCHFRWRKKNKIWGSLVRTMCWLLKNIKNKMFEILKQCLHLFSHMESWIFVKEDYTFRKRLHINVEGFTKYMSAFMVSPWSRYFKRTPLWSQNIETMIFWGERRLCLIFTGYEELVCFHCLESFGCLMVDLHVVSSDDIT